MLLFFAPKFRSAQICATFQLEMGQQIGLYTRFIIFWTNAIVSASEMAFLKLSFQCAIFFLRQNLDSRKFEKHFEWKWVNGQDTQRGTSFFRQIPSFRPSKWHFFENFRSGARFFFFLRQNFCSHKLVQLFVSK